MECRNCQTVNRGDADACAGCGQPLAGAPRHLASAAPQPDSERRQLTVMFCDLVGSTNLSQSLDPEDLHELIHAYQQAAGRVTARYDGFVASYMGDGILMYFGYPRAHEDDAQRAILTGLDIIAELNALSEAPDAGLPASLAVRIGIATGLVVVGDLPKGTLSEVAVALGATPNLAARLQSLAEPGSVVIAEETRKLAGTVFDYADLGPQDLKGFDQPIRVWRVERQRATLSRFEAVHGNNLTPFVGRLRELTHLAELWRRASRCNGQVAVLGGEAGIGKSRIAETLCQRIAGDVHQIVRFQCSPFHAHSALYPIIRQLEIAADFSCADSPAEKLDKLERQLSGWTSITNDATALLAALLSLPTLGRYPDIDLSSAARKQQTLALLARRLTAMATEAPLLVLFEDAHWIDPTSAELLGMLARDAADHAILLLVTSREAGGLTWLGDKLGHVSLLSLDRLERSDAASMIRRLAGRRDWPDDVIQQIVRHTDGIPLFIEELAQAVAGSDAAASESTRRIPATLRDSLMARLDQSGPAKAVAQIASVIGRDFPLEALTRLAGLTEPTLSQMLAQLIDCGILVRPDPASGDQFRFKHALLQEAAYSSLLRRNRRGLHRRMAELLVSHYPHRAGNEPEVVAYHYESAGDAAKSADFWIAAARRALGRAANQEILGHTAAGLNVLAGLPPSADRDQRELVLLILRGAAFRAIEGFASAKVEQKFHAALKICERLGHAARLIDVRRGLFSYYYAQGDLKLAREQGEQLVRQGEEYQDPTASMLGHWMRGCIAVWQGELLTAEADLNRSMALYRPQADKIAALAMQIDPYVNAECHLTWVKWLLGQAEDALVAADHAVDAARRLSQPMAMAMALFFAVETRACSGQPAAENPLLDELFALTDEHALGYFADCACLLKAQDLIASGRSAAGVDLAQRAVTALERQNARLGLAWARSIVAQGQLLLGQADAALITIDDALELAESSGERIWEAELWRLRAESQQGVGAAQEEAKRSLERALAVATRQSAESLRLRAEAALKAPRDGRRSIRPAAKAATDAEAFTPTDQRDDPNLSTA